MSIEVLFVRKLLLVDLKLRCIRPDFDDFRSENVKPANHRPVFQSNLEYRPLIGWKTGVRIALTLLLFFFKAIKGGLINQKYFSFRFHYH